MSSTEIHYFNKEGNAFTIDEVKNAWRGAMQVWRILEEKYLPPFHPHWYHKPISRFSAPEELKLKEEVWALWKDPRLTKTERTVFGSTMDDVIVIKKDFPELIKALRDFEGETNLSEQADFIEQALNNDNIIACGWNQTSVMADSWANAGGYDEKHDKEIPYNILTGDVHWDLFKGMAWVSERSKEPQI